MLVDLNMPEGVVLVRKARGPDGIHGVLGMVREGYVYSVAVSQLPALVASGEFVEVDLLGESDAAADARS